MATLVTAAYAKRWKDSKMQIKDLPPSNTPIQDMTDVEIVMLMRSDHPLNIIRKAMNKAASQIERAERAGGNPFVMRRLEFQVAKDIAKVMGIEL